MYNRTLSFYTDGAYSSKSEMGGWAAVCIEDGQIIDERSGYEPYTTNNRMELMAILSALENIATIETTNTKVLIYTDSAYIANCFNQNWYSNWISNGWRTADRQSVKNQDLWKRIIALYIRAKSRFGLEVIKVASHSGDKWNTYVDHIAVKRRKELEVDDQ
jgi:ribonuclease HI